MFFDWFDARAAREFGVLLAALVVETVPPTAKLKDAAFRKKALRTLEKLSQRVARFKSEQKPNIYKKAKLGNAFKWALRDAGYEQAYVDDLTDWLMLKL